MTVTGRLITGAIFLLIILGVAAWEVVSLNEQQLESERLAQFELEVLSLSADTWRLVTLQQDLVLRFDILAEAEYAERVEVRALQIGRALEQVERLAPQSVQPDFSQSVINWWEFRQRAHVLEDRIVERSRGILLATEKERAAESEAIENYRGERTVQHSALLFQLERVREETRTAMSRRLRATSDRIRRATAVLLITLSGALLSTIALSLWLTQAVSRPLKQLAEGTGELALGDFQHRVTPSGSTELVQVAREFNAMAERLGQMDRLQRDFVATVSHDLKAPLASMQEVVELLLDGSVGDLTEKQKRLLRLNRESSDRLSQMITNLLDLARLESGAVDYQMSHLELEGIVRTVLLDLGSLVQQKSLLLEEHYESGCAVWGDAAYLQQVAANLLGNAIKFSPAGGTVKIRIHAHPDGLERRPAVGRRVQLPRPPYVTFSVEDAGPGIADPEKERVFDRFYRGGSSVGTVRSTGLGLAIAEAVVRRHGGAIWVEDAEPAGSRFVVALERASVARPAARRRVVEGAPA